VRRTKATQIYRKTGNLRAVQFLLGLKSGGIAAGEVRGGEARELRSGLTESCFAIFGVPIPYAALAAS
jgi:hypothetical protein